MAKLKMFRVWYKDGSARLVNAATEREAKEQAKELAEIAALDISHAFTTAKTKNPDRARELRAEWLGCTTVMKVEVLS